MHSRMLCNPFRKFLNGMAWQDVAKRRGDYGAERYEDEAFQEKVRAVAAAAASLFRRRRRLPFPPPPFRVQFFAC